MLDELDDDILELLKGLPKNILKAKKEQRGLIRAYTAVRVCIASRQAARQADPTPTPEQP